MPDDYSDLTLLRLEPMGVQPYSARGLVQTYTPIAAAAQLKRTINGRLHDLSAPQFRKFASNISCTDQAPPPFDGVAIGTLLQVDCAFQFSFITDGGQAVRPIVPGSSRQEGRFTFYRPRMLMRVANFSQQEDEWKASIGWTLDLEEE